MTFWASPRKRNSRTVGADGAVSTVASAFGFPSINDYVLTYKGSTSAQTSAARSNTYS